MRVALIDGGGIAQTMSRIPFGGFAVLDIARSMRLKEKGPLSEKSIDLSSTKSHLQILDKYLSSLGLGDFGNTVDASGTSSDQQSVGQLEASSLHRFPIMHRVESRSTQKSANRSTTEPCLDLRRLSQPQGGVS